jgi:asparagine synthase (glutamine-hydrolysing)
MSVIAGIVRFSGEPVHVAELEPAAQRLAAPGLSDAAFWTEGMAGLLARQHFYTNEDLAERQPWVGAGGRLVLVYDGRLDNREDIAAALSIRLNGETVPDGQLLLAALERWGEQALPRLIGDFALALWDKQKRELLLARDQMGRRTLYFHHGGNFVAFASTYRALLTLPGVPKKIDELGVADFLVLNMRHPVQTLYEGARRVPKASCAVFNKNGLRQSKYWELEVKRPIRFSSDEEYVEAMREQLERAVSCRLRVRNPVAAVMSGGLDSSAVAATAARLLAPSRILTVTSVPPEGMALSPLSPAWYVDERPYVKAIAAMHPNMDPVLASSDAPHWIETDPLPFFEANGTPARNVSNLGWLMPGYDAVTNSGSNVMLIGEGGNYGWSWDGLRTLSDYFRHGHWLRLARELALIDRNRPYGMRWQVILRSEVLAPQEPRPLKRWRKKLRESGGEPWTDYSAINPAFAKEINLFRRMNEAKFDFTGPTGALELRLEMINRSEHGPDVTAAIRAVNGLEVRAPLWDIRLLEFCLSIPEEQFLRHGVTRRLTRLALADRLPRPVLDNYRLGAQNPEIFRRQERMRASMLEEIESFKQTPLAACCLDLSRLRKIVREWPADNMQVPLMLPRALNMGRFLRWAEKEF